MSKLIDIKLTPIYSPICQTLIYEEQSSKLVNDKSNDLEDSKELLIIRLEGTIIAYATFYVVDGVKMNLKSLHFRSIIKDHSLGSYWLTRLLQRRFKKEYYLEFLLAS